MMPTPRPDRARLRAAVAAANLPTLVMVLFHLTGDRRWLRDPYRPGRTRGLGPNDAGGFDEATAGRIRAEAVAAIESWSRGAPVAEPNPSADLLRDMLTTCVGEPVPEEYERLMREEMGFGPAPEPTPVPAERVAARDFSVVVIGAGASGLIAGMRLRAAGIPFVILERNADVGGVWLTNTYPGAGVDTPSYLYSFSFFRHNWSTHFGKRDEVAGYLADMADHFELRGHIRFGVTVDALRYHEHARRWAVTAHGPDGVGQEYSATAVISAVGLFHTPKLPELPGMGSFRGPIFHSARWPDGLDLAGKHVAVVGTGASATQVVPAIAPRVERVTVLQRSPQWIAPDEEYHRPIGPDVHWLMDNVPYYHAWYRFRLAWVFNDRVHPSLRIDPAWPHPERSLNAVNDGHRRYFTRHLTEQLADRPDLIEKCLPDYPPFGKRMLLDTGWYAALKRDNVELIAEGVAEVTPTGLVSTGGRTVEVDAVVLATGFDAQRYPGSLRVTGRDGRTLREVWGEDDASAHLGISVPGFPNLFLMYGPNTNAGAGGSFIFIAEAQGRYIVELLERMVRHDIGALECRPEALRRWVTEVDAAHAQMVWSHPGMTTYYRNARGRVVTNSPYRVVDYWAMTREPDLADFDAEPVAATSAVSRSSDHRR